MSLRLAMRDLLAKFPAIDAAFRRAIWSRIHFPEGEMFWLAGLSGRPFDVAIDVGAAMGGYAWLMNRKARRVLAFEPGHEHFAVLSSGARGTRIELVKKAVGAAAGTLPLITPGEDTDARHSATLSRSNPVVAAAQSVAYEVEVVTLDQYCAQNLSGGERVDFLKVDVEGFENEVILGAREMIARDYPIILCEIEARHNPNWKQVFGELAALGYRARFMGDGSLCEIPEEGIEALQKSDDLRYRLSSDYRPGTSRYFNNFMFLHEKSKIQIL